MLVLSSGESIERLKLGGFEIVTRIEKAIDEAYATVSMLNNATVPVLKYELQLVVDNVSRDYDGSNVVTNLKSFQNVKNLIKSSSFHDDDLNNELFYAKEAVIDDFKNFFSNRYVLADKLEGMVTYDGFGNTIDFDVKALEREILSTAARESIDIDKQYMKRLCEQLKEFVIENIDIKKQDD